MGLFRNIAICAAALYPALAAADAPASTGRISSIQFSGNGCPDTGDVTWTGDFDGLDIKFRSFKPTTATATDKSQNCEVHIQAAGVSAGWQVAVSDIYLKGHVWLDAGETFTAFTQTYFSASADATSTLRSKITNSGTGSTDYPVVVHQVSTKPVWSSCSGGDGVGILNVDLVGALSGNGNGAFAATEEDLDFIWRKC